MSFESVFCIKTVNKKYLKNYLEIRKSCFLTEVKLPKKSCFIKIGSWYGQRLTFCHLFLPASWFA